MGKIIAVSSNKGGILKTSLTTNLAGVLSKEGKKVLIVDTDNQANVMLTFGENPDEYENTLFEVLTEDFPIRDAIVNVHENIYVLPANENLAYFDMRVLDNQDIYPNYLELFKEKIEEIRDEFDVILVDTPPNMGIIVANVLMAVDSVIVPFHPETYNIRSIIKTIEAIENFKTRNEKLEILGVVPTKVKLNTSIHNETLNLCQQFCNTKGIKITKNVVKETIKYAASLAKNRLPLTLVDKKEKEEVVQDYFNLVKELGL
ncbi:MULTISPECIES: ParA family protein [Bacillus cereus group]|uniref:ParA family protein n=1 Tax=Bacillus cereus group TaxID=86661 RepID=UPI001D0E1ECB|nr:MULTISPECIES: ParA family protein [Bacillus cereus group]MCC2341750.1 ParA family protein [Bacillus tropicus]BCC15166.1 sporulation initiation inhibitor protein Soj [Bacillus cereus]